MHRAADGGTHGRAPAPGPRCSSGRSSVDHADTAELVALRRHQPGPDGRAQPLAGRAGRTARCRPTPPATSPAMLDRGARRHRPGHHRGRHPRRVHRGRARRRLRRHHREADDRRRRRLPADPGRGRAHRPAGRRSPSTTATTRCTRRSARLLAERRDRRDRLGALRVAARRAPRRRLLPPLAPRQGQLRRPAGAQGRATTSTWSTGGSAPTPADGVRATAGCSSTATAGARHGYARDYDRAHGAPAAADDPFALRPGRQPAAARALPRRRGTRTATSATRTSSRPGVTIEDDMAVLVALRHRRDDDLPPHRVRAVGGLPGRWSTAAGAGWSWRSSRATTSARPARARSRAPRLHGVEAAAEDGRRAADRPPVLGSRPTRCRCRATPAAATAAPTRG